MDAAMSSAVSALQAQSSALSTVSNNLANAQTTGYKAVVTQFNSLLTQDAVGIAYPAGGVQAVARQNLLAQGNVTSTTNTTDMAINGNGMFPVTNGVGGSEVSYTRDGAFDANSTGDLVLAGTNYALVGWPTDVNGNVTETNPDNVASLQSVNINKYNSSAVATTTYALQANLPAEAQSTALSITMSDGASPANDTQVTMSYSKVSGPNPADSTGASSPGGVAQPNPYSVYELTIAPANSTTTLTDGNGGTAGAGQPLTYYVTVDSTGAITGTTAAGATLSTLTAGSALPTIASATDTSALGGAGDTYSTSVTTQPTTWADLGTPFSKQTSMSVYDSLGVEQTFPVTWTAEGNNAWMMTVGTPTNPAGTASTGTLTDSAGNNVSSYSYQITFNSDGSLSSVTGLPTGLTNASGVAGTAPMGSSNNPILSATWTDGAAAMSALSNTGVSVNLGTAGVIGVGQTNGLSQLDTGETTPTISVKSTIQNGVQYGQLTGVTINSAGEVIAAYDNGQKVPIFKIPVVTFPNENGLTAQSGGVYQQSSLSGDYTLNQAGTNGAGTISGEALEASTVDTSTEFANMITAQQAYSSASQVIGVDKQDFTALLQVVQ